MRSHIVRILAATLLMSTSNAAYAQIGPISETPVVPAPLFEGFELSLIATADPNETEEGKIRTLGRVAAAENGGQIIFPANVVTDDPSLFRDRSVLFSQSGKIRTELFSGLWYDEPLNSRLGISNSGYIFYEILSAGTNPKRIVLRKPDGSESDVTHPPYDFTNTHKGGITNEGFIHFGYYDTNCIRAYSLTSSGAVAGLVQDDEYCSRGYGSNSLHIRFSNRKLLPTIPATVTHEIPLAQPACCVPANGYLRTNPSFRINKYGRASLINPYEDRLEVYSFDTSEYRLNVIPLERRYGSNFFNGFSVQGSAVNASGEVLFGTEYTEIKTGVHTVALFLALPGGGVVEVARRGQVVNGKTISLIGLGVAGNPNVGLIFDDQLTDNSIVYFNASFQDGTTGIVQAKPAGGVTPGAPVKAIIDPDDLAGIGILDPQPGEKYHFRLHQFCSIPVINAQTGETSPRRCWSFWDPEIAGGYNFEALDAATRFESLIIPEPYGDGLFDLYAYDGAISKYVDTGVDLEFGVAYAIADLLGEEAGVDKFSIRGIEADSTDSENFTVGLDFYSFGAPESGSVDVFFRQVAVGDEQVSVTGDLDGDRDVDRDDLAVLHAARNQPAQGADDSRDLDGDGTVTALDARRLTQLCTRPRCATE